MKTLKRKCIKDWEITAGNGDRFEIKKGMEYITSKDREEGTCMVFGGFWVKVPLCNFANVA